MVGDPWTKKAQQQKKQVDFCNADYKSMVSNLTAKSPIKQRPRRLSRVVVYVNVHSVDKATCSKCGIDSGGADRTTGPADFSIPDWPAEASMLSDYMSGLVLLNRHQAAGERSLTWHPITWKAPGLQPVILKVIAEDSRGLLASVGSHRCCSADGRMGL